MPSNRVDRALRFVLEGDSKSATTAFLEFEAAAAKAEKATADMAVKIQADFRAMEEQAKVAAASIAKIGETGAGAGGATGGGLMDLFSSGGGMALGLETAGLAVAHFGEQSVQAFTRTADSVRIFQQTTGASAEEASKLVNLSGLLGVSTETLAQGMGRFGANIEKNALSLRQHGIEIASNKDGTIDLAGTFVNVAAALGQSTDAAERDALARQLLGRGYQQLLPLLTQSGDELKRLGEMAHQGPILSQEEVDRALHFQEQMRLIGQHVNDVKARVGNALIENLDTTVQGAKNLDDQLGHISSHIKEIADLTPSWLGHALGMGAFHAAAELALGPLAPIVSALKEIGGTVTPIGPAGQDAGNAAANGFDTMGKSATITEGKVWSLNSAITSARNAWSAFEANANFAENAADSFDKALQAFDTASTKAGGAASNLAYAQEQGAQRIADAQQRIVDAEESSSRRVVDAQTRVKEAREAAADALKSATQSVEDAKQHLVDEQLAALRDSNPYAAQRRVDVARRDLGRAEERLSSTQDRESENVARAELELQRAQEDRTKAITKANEALTKTQEEVAHSLEHAGSAAGGASASLGDMKSKVDALVKATGDHVDAMVLQGKGLDDIAKAVETAKAKVDEVGAAWGWPQAQVDAYKAKLDAIPKNVTTTIGLTLDSYAFKTQIDALVQQISPAGRAGPLGDLVRAGIEAAVTGSGFIADEGATLPPGLNLIHNKTGHDEYIVNPSMASPTPLPAMGGGVTVNVYPTGSVLTEHDLADFIVRAVKQGTAGYR